VQKVREAAARIKCANNLKQLGLSVHNYESANQKFPAGFTGNAPTGAPAYFYSWSTLAILNPFLEQTNIYNSMDLNVPVYALTSPYNVLPQNQFAVVQKVPLFLCPSDKQEPVSNAYGVTNLGPTNYAACLSTGLANGAQPAGSPWDANGAFFAQSKTTITAITDGTSNTACMSESLLGDGAENATSATPPSGSTQTSFKYIGFGTPLSDSACASGTTWNGSNRRGFMWASGEIRCAAYNHYYTPNNSLPDCVANAISLPGDQYPGQRAYTAVGWRGARSRHSGGVNILLCDGSVRFVTNSVDINTWRALATRAGGEVLGDF
jgi:prepilin-type processing-associated H-X9-DG protein